MQRKLRALLTALAVVLGVAMVSGTLMLTDSIQRAFDSIFTSSYAQTDAVVAGTPVVEGSVSGDPTVSVALLPRIQAPSRASRPPPAASSTCRASPSALTLSAPTARRSPAPARECFGFGVDPDPSAASSRSSLDTRAAGPTPTASS